MNSRLIPWRGAGVLRLLVGLILAAAVVYEIVDKLRTGQFIASQYFLYFTNLSAFLTIAVFVASGVSVARGLGETSALSIARLCVVVYEIVNSLAYVILDRDIANQGYVIFSWASEAIHVWVPVYVLLDWILFPPDPRAEWSALRIVPIFPALWIVITIARGNIDGWYPYPFLQPSVGIASIAITLTVIAASIFALAAAGIAYSRARVRPARDQYYY